MSEHDADVERIVRNAFRSLRPGDDLGNGLVAVPREPTEAMVECIGKVSCAGKLWPEIGPAIYRAMIAAAHRSIRGGEGADMSASKQSKSRTHVPVEDLNEIVILADRMTDHLKAECDMPLVATLADEVLRRLHGQQNQTATMTLAIALAHTVSKAQSPLTRRAMLVAFCNTVESMCEAFVAAKPKL